MSDKTKEKKSGSGAIFAALGANIGVFAMKLIVGIISGSASMMAEAIHSFSDCGNQVALIAGRKIADTRDPNAKHPFGYTMSRYLASLIVALLLFFVGGLYSLISSARTLGEIIHEGGFKEIEGKGIIISLIVILFSILLESFSLRAAFKEAKEHREKEELTELGLFKFWKETKASELACVLAEDALAIIGLIIAGIGVLLAIFTKNELFDALGGTLVGIIIIIGGIFLTYKMCRLIIGEAPNKKVLDRILSITKSTPGVGRIINHQITHKSEDVILVCIKLEIIDDEHVDDSLIINAIESELYKQLPQYKLQVYIEPDRYDAKLAGKISD